MEVRNSKVATRPPGSKYVMIRSSLVALLGDVSVGGTAPLSTSTLHLLSPRPPSTGMLSSSSQSRWEPCLATVYGWDNQGTPRPTRGQLGANWGPIRYNMVPPHLIRNTKFWQGSQLFLIFKKQLVQPASQFFLNYYYYYYYYY